MGTKILKVFLLLISIFAFSQSRLNFGFESGMKKWASNERKYKIEIDSTTKFSGGKSLKISGENIPTEEKDDFAVITQKFSSKNVQGKEITLKARIKSESESKSVAYPYLKTLDKDGKNVSFINLAKKPVHGNTDWTEVKLKLPILENVENIHFGFIFSGKGSAWFDNVEILVDGKSIETPIKELTSEDKISIKKYIYPLNTFEPTENESDLKILDKLIGNSKVVALGESTHGTSEIYKMKDRITRYLVKNQKFDIFALEAYMQQAYLVNNYTVGNSLTLENALKNLAFFVWRTEEMSEMLQWMKTYNNGSEKIKFTGFDMQSATEPLNQLTAVFSDNNEMLQKIETLSANVKTVVNQNYGKYKPYVVNKEQADILYPIISDLKNEIDNNPKLSATDKTWQLQNIRIVEQLLQTSTVNRDRFMAENFMWTMKQNPDSKFIISAHNGHISNAKNRMGQILKKNLKDNYKTFGFAFYDGDYRAMSEEVKIVGPQTAEKPYPGTYEHWLNSLNIPVFILDLKEMKKDKDLAWLVSDLDFRSVGHTKHSNEFYPTNISENFDYLVFINKSTSSVPAN